MSFVCPLKFEVQIIILFLQLGKLRLRKSKWLVPNHETVSSGAETEARFGFIHSVLLSLGYATLSAARRAHIVQQTFIVCFLGAGIIHSSVICVPAASKPLIR